MEHGYFMRCSTSQVAGAHDAHHPVRLQARLLQAARRATGGGAGRAWHGEQAPESSNNRPLRAKR